MATYVNSLSVAVKGNLLSNPPPVLLCALSLFFTLAGSVAYCMGTLGYYPEVTYTTGYSVGEDTPWSTEPFNLTLTPCHRDSNQVETKASPADASVSCTTQWDSVTLGTNLYVIGAVFYVVSGILNLTAACVKGRQHRAEEDAVRENSAGRLKVTVKAVELADTSEA